AIKDSGMNPQAADLKQQIEKLKNDSKKLEATEKIIKQEEGEKYWQSLENQVLVEVKKEFLTGDLVVENLNKLEELILYDVRELDKVIIKNCSELKKISLFNSGVRQLELGLGLGKIEELSIGFEINPIHRPTARKLDEVDLSKITNLKSLKCVGVQETKLSGFEKLTQLEFFRGDEKGGSGSDKDDVDPVKLNDYKNRPTKGQLDQELNKIKTLLGLKKQLVKKTDLDKVQNKVKEYENGLKLKTRPTSSNSGVPISKDQWDNDYSKRPTRQELEKVQKDKEKVQKLHDLIKNGAISKFKDEWKKKLEIEEYYNQIEQSTKIRDKNNPGGGVDCDELTGELVIDGFVNTKAINFERRSSTAAMMQGKITKLTIKNCPNLESIDLDENEIEEINFDGKLLKLKKLDVRDNLLKKFSVWAEFLRKLKTFDFTGINGETEIKNKLGGKNLQDIPSGQTLKSLIDVYNSDKGDLQNQLKQAQAELSKKSDYDAIKTERDQLKQQMAEIVSKLGLAGGSTNQQINEKITELMNRPSGPSSPTCSHTDYDSIKSEKDRLNNENAQLKSENERLKTKKRRFLTDVTNLEKNGIKISDKDKARIINAGSAEKTEEVRSEIIGDKFNELKGKNDNSTILNVGLGVLAIGSLLILEAQNDYEKAGAIQAFEVCYELAKNLTRKVLLLRAQAVPISPKEIFRLVGLEGLISDAE
ncbi:1508_t:CDS:2, partial [Funneliformis geosporum]